MQIDFAFICDYAEARDKINALGIGFEVIYAKQIPAKHNHFSLVFQLRASVVEAGQKAVNIDLIDEDGTNIVPPITGNIMIKKRVPGTDSVARMAIEFSHVEFPRYGIYSLHVTVDGHEMARIPLRVAEPPLKSPPPAEQQ